MLFWFVCSTCNNQKEISMDYRYEAAPNIQDVDYRSTPRIDNLNFSGLDIAAFLVASLMTLAPLAMGAFYTTGATIVV